MSNKDFKRAKDGSITDSQKQYAPLKEEIPPNQVRTRASLIAARIKAKLESKK